MADARELYDACDDATAGRATGWRPWPRQAVLWLSSPTAQVGERTWHARRRRHGRSGVEYGYTVRQCARIRKALLPVLACYGTPLERDITRHMC